ncbi:MAG: DUF3109 family protein [Bacteroidetes bacterium]|nr:MAG: DUF3109 family protein [Bacteroidota bacterium]
MIQIDDKLISSEVVEELFACDISRCKGACCVEGDLGAPLEDEELAILEEIYPKVKPFLRKAGIRAIEQQGTWVRDFTQSHSTPLVEGRECAYVTFSPEGVALCGIEQAWQAGKIDFQKPISCHLYPIRTSKHRDFEALNYDRWDICSPACKLGRTEGIRVYEFVKGALIRRYGEAFYEELDGVVKAWLADRQQASSGSESDDQE